jgi:Zn-dependent protease
LEQLATEAQRREFVEPWAAIDLWRQCLDLLPANSQQYQMISDRIGALTAGLAAPGAWSTSPSSVQTYEGGGQAMRHHAPPVQSSNPLRSTLLTLGSMVVSAIVYRFYLPDFGVDQSWRVSFGFVILMLVHEMGHVVANWYYGISASPPIFIPFMGAVINLRQRPPNAKVEAIIGIGGPIAGTVGALACYLVYLLNPAGAAWLLVVAWLGFLLNLFNLLPVPPLDGGRVTAAVSPWIWMLGIAGLVGLFLYDLKRGTTDYILILVLFYAWPRIWQTLRGGGRNGEYFRISRRSSWSIAVLYVALGVMLMYLYLHVGQMLGVV